MSVSAGASTPASHPQGKHGMARPGAVRRYCSGDKGSREGNSGDLRITRTHSPAGFGGCRLVNGNDSEGASSCKMKHPPRGCRGGPLHLSSPTHTERSVNSSYGVRGGVRGLSAVHPECASRPDDASATSPLNTVGIQPDLITMVCFTFFTSALIFRPNGPWRYIPLPGRTAAQIGRACKLTTQPESKGPFLPSRGRGARLARGRTFCERVSVRLVDSRQSFSFWWRFRLRRGMIDPRASFRRLLPASPSGGCVQRTRGR